MKLPKLSKKSLLIVLTAMVLVVAWRQVARNEVNDELILRMQSNIAYAIKSAESRNAKQDTVTFLALGDVAKCRPESLYAYLRIGLHYLARGHVASYGDAEGAAQTSELVARYPHAEILGLGDLVYPHGSLFSYRHCFAKYFGAAYERIHPVPGNHDYKKSDAAGYFDYWGAKAGTRGKGYYSIDRGHWHVVALNSEITGKPLREQMEWLEADLSKTTAPCILAFLHRPPFSARDRGTNWPSLKLFRILYEHGVTLLLAGHNHFYERTAPLNGTGDIRDGRGIRTFVVGTGGADMPYGGRHRNFTESLVTRTWGVLKLDLSEKAYVWNFISAPNGDVKDSGTGECVNRKSIRRMVDRG